MQPSAMNPIRPLVVDPGAEEVEIPEFLADRRVVTPLFHSEGTVPGRYKLDGACLLDSLTANVTLVGESRVRLLMVMLQTASFCPDWGEDIVSGIMRNGLLTVRVRKHLVNRLAAAQLARARSEARLGSSRAAEVPLSTRKRKDPEEEGEGVPTPGGPRQGNEPQRRRVVMGVGDCLAAVGRPIQ